MLCCKVSKFALTLAAGVAGGFVLQASLAPSYAIQPEGEPTAEQMMDMMKEMARPVAQHEVLKNMAGTWDCHAKFYMAGPDAPPTTSTGVSEARLVLGGRYVYQDIKMDDFMGDKFEGMGFVGFDRASGVYVNDWIDNWSTGIMRMTGEYDESTGIFDWRGSWSMATPDGPVDMPAHHVIRPIDKDSFVMEFWEMGETGQEVLGGEIRYTRRK